MMRALGIALTCVVCWLGIAQVTMGALWIWGLAQNDTARANGLLMAGVLAFVVVRDALKDPP